MLHVGDVAAEADDCGVGVGAEAFDVGEAGEGAVGCKVVGGDYDSVCELEGYD